MKEMCMHYKNHLTEEMADIKSYMDMSCELKKSGNDLEAQIVKDIAKDESTHAKHIIHMLEKNDYNVEDAKNTLHAMLAEYGL
jgi:ferritin